MRRKIAWTTAPTRSPRRNGDGLNDELDHLISQVYAIFGEVTLKRAAMRAVQGVVRQAHRASEEDLLAARDGSASQVFVTVPADVWRNALTKELRVLLTIH